MTHHQDELDALYRRIADLSDESLILLSQYISFLKWQEEQWHSPEVWEDVKGDEVAWIYDLIEHFAGARQMVGEMIAEMRAASPLPIEQGATSYPPRTEYANVDATRYILEGAGLEVLSVPDEPTAANRVLGIDNGAIVDVGGGTTGIAVIQEGRVVFTDDEATGGVHLTLVVAGNRGIGYEQAEKIKTDPAMNREVLSMVRPVIEKIAAIVEKCLRPFGGLKRVCLVGGTCALEGFAGIVEKALGLETFRPPFPQYTTPLGIALSCLDAQQQATAAAVRATGENRKKK